MPRSLGLEDIVCDSGKSNIGLDGAAMIAFGPVTGFLPNHNAECGHYDDLSVDVKQTET